MWYSSETPLPPIISLATLAMSRAVWQFFRFRIEISAGATWPASFLRPTVSAASDFRSASVYTAKIYSIPRIISAFSTDVFDENTSYMNRADPILDHRRFHRAYRPFCTAWVVVWQVACQIGFDQECTVVPGGSRLRRRPWHPSQYRSVRCWDSQRVRRDRRHRGADFQRELSHYPRKLNQFRMHGGSICPRNLYKAIQK